MPGNTSTNIKVTAAAVQAALQGTASHIETYSSDLHIMDMLQDSNQVASMTLEDWHQAQEADSIPSLVQGSQFFALSKFHDISMI